MRYSEPCEHFAQNASTYDNLCTRLYSSKVATTLLQPRNFHRDYIFIEAKLIYDSSTLPAWHLKNPSKTQFIQFETICNAILCEVSQ